MLDGEPVAYACTRPPGHHVTRDAFGGSCYLNSTAIAAQHLRNAGIGTVAILDVDAHQGNGAEAIFRDRDDVRTCSVHVDPSEGWFPHFLGFADDGGIANLNLPLPTGSGDDQWLTAVEKLVAAARAHGTDALVVPLGVDAASGDPNSPLEVTEGGFREAGRLLSAPAVPTVLVQEGGYVVETIGALVRATLEGFEEGAGR
jgi:acetoin utilization deacetylase AcuC-like enzyme